MSELLIKSDLSLLNDRILNLGSGLATMPKNGTMQVSKAFLNAVLGYMGELLGMRRAQPANEPLTLDELREMDEPSPIWKEEPPSGDMTESRVEPVLFNGVHQRGKEEIVCWVTCEAHHANARVEHITAGRINFYRRPPERSDV